MKIILKPLAVTALCALSATAAYAQEAFRHLSAGVEAGTTGIGIQLAIPVVTDHLVLSVGYNMPDFRYSVGSSLPMDSVNDQIREANDIISIKNAAYGTQVPLVSELRDADITAGAHINFNAVKAMLEYYPFRRSGFHIKAGVVIGMGSDDILLGAGAAVDKSFWNNFQDTRTQVNDISRQYPGWGLPDIDNPAFELDGKTYTLKEGNGSAYFGANIKTARVRPYVGIGFGRAIPRSRVSFQTDFGAWFHGAPQLDIDAWQVDPRPGEMNDPVRLDEGFDIHIIEKVSVYPALTVRINVRLF